MSTYERMTAERIAALAAAIDVDPSAIDEAPHGENVYCVGLWEYLVLTDEEADEACAEYIRESLWAFDANWLASFLKTESRQSVAKSIRAIQEAVGEDANPALRLMVGDRMDELVHAAIDEDGRGHFLASYDGREIGQDEYFIYRVV